MPRYAPFIADIARDNRVSFSGSANDSQSFSRSDLFSSTCLAVLIAGTGAAGAQAEETAPLWGSWVEAGGQAGDEAAAFVEGFVPIGQDEESLIFLDLRLSVADRGTGYTSFGFGARHIVGPDLAIGANAFVDGIRTDNSNTYAGFGVGFEAFTSRFDLHVNGYIPLGGDRTVGTTFSTVSVDLDGSSLIETLAVTDRKEAPLYGIGAELGTLLDSPLGEDKFRAYIGGYHYDRDGYDHQSGGRLGLEYRVEDPFGLDGARLTFGAEGVYNQDHEIDGLASARLRIPLFGGARGDGEGESRTADLSPLQRQLDERIRRDAVVRAGERSVSAGTTTAPVRDAELSAFLDDIQFVDGANNSGGAGTLSDPTSISNAISNAGEDGFIVLLGGSNGALNASGITLLNGQTLVGGGGSIPIRLFDGTLSTFQFNQSNGTISGTLGATTINVADGVTISDLTIDGGGTAIAGVGSVGVTLRNLTIQNITGDGVNIPGAVGTTIDHVDFNNISGTALFLNNRDATITDVTITNAGAGIDIQNNTGTTTLSNISINNVMGNGVSFSNNTGAIGVSNLSVAGVGDDGVVISGGGTFSFSGTTAIGGLGTNAASDGIDLSGTDGATLSFEDIAITGVQNGSGLNLSSGFNATVSASTLSISGSGGASGTGVDLSGSSATASVSIGTGTTSNIGTGVVLGTNGSAGTSGEAELTWSSGAIGGTTSLDGVGVDDGDGDYDFSSTELDTFNFATFAGSYFVSATGTGMGTSIDDAASLADAISFASANTGGATIVLVNDGVYSTTATLVLANDNITLGSFGNGASYQTGGLDIADSIQGANIPDRGGEFVTDSRGAATLVNTAGDTVQVDGNNVTIANINLGNEAANSYAITGSGTSGLSIEGVNIGAGATNSNGGISLTNTSGNVTISDTAIEAANGIVIAGAAGTISADNVDVTGSNAIAVTGGDADISFDAQSSVTNTGGTAVGISGRVGGTFSHFGDIASNGAGSAGISVTGGTGTNAVAFGGDVNLGLGAALAAGSGVAFNGNSAGTSLTFANLDIATDGQTGFAASGGGTIGIGNGSIASNDATALDLDGIGIAGAGANFSSIDVTGTAPGAGVSLNGIGGSGTFAGGDVTIAGTSGGAAGIAVSNSTASIGFGAVDISGVDGDGISLAGNSGAVSFGATNIALGAGVNAAGIDIEGTNGQITFGDTIITGVGANQTGIDFATADAPASFGVTAITGTDGTGIDLSSTQNNRAITFATGSSITLSGASAVGVELASDGTSATAANANFTFGDGSGTDANGTFSTIAVANGITVNTVGVQVAQGTYNFEDVAFTGNAAYETAGLQFVYDGATEGSGSLLDPFTVAQALAAADTDQTFVFLDGSYNFTATFVLDDGQSVIGFDNGREVATDGPPANVTGLGIVSGDVISRATQMTGGITIANNGGTDIFSFLGSGMIADLTIDGAGGGDIFAASGTSGAITVDGITAGGIAAGQSAFDFDNVAGTVTVQNASLTTAGGGFVAVSGGSADYSFTNVTTAGTGTASDTGIEIDGLGAGGGFSFDTALNLAGFSTGIDIENAAGAVTFGNTTTISEAATAGIAVGNSSGNVTFNGRTTIANTVAAGNGIDLGLGAGGANTGTYTFNGLDVTVNGVDAYGLRARSSGTVNVFDPNGDNQITSNNGTAVFINPTLVNIALADVTSQNATGSGLDLELLSGSTFTVTGTASVTGSDIAGVEIVNSGGSVISFGTLNIDNDDAPADGAGLVVNNSAGGAVTVNVSGGSIASGDEAAVDIVNSGAGDVILGQTYSFVSVNGANRGVSVSDAAGGGTVSGILSTGAAGTIQNTTGAAVYLESGEAQIFIGQDIVTSTGRVADLRTLALGSTVNIGGNINATGGTGISASQLGGANVTFSGASKVLSTGANTAVSLSDSSAATFSFTGGGLDIDTTSGRGFFTINAGSVTVTGANNTIDSGSGRALDLATTTIGDAGFNLASVSSSGAANAIVLDTLGQTGSSTGLNVAGGSISGATTRGVDLHNISADVAIGADISASGTGRSVEVTNSGVSGGNAITFSGAITDTGAGINLDNNDQNGGMATITFSGGLNLNTGANTAFNFANGGIVDIAGAASTIQTTSATAINALGGTLGISGSNVAVVTTSGTGINATGGGTVVATGTGNSVATATGTAVNIDGATVGASGFALKSVSADGAVNGIVLKDTGNTGGVFEITGDGANGLDNVAGTIGGGILGSGGTITNTAGDAIVLNNAHNVTLRNLIVGNAARSAADGYVGGSKVIMGNGVSVSDASSVIFDNVKIADAGMDGISGTSVTNLIIRNSEILNSGITGGHAGLDIANLFGGSNEITETIVAGAAEHNVHIENTLSGGGGPDTLTVAYSEFGRNEASATGADGILFSTLNNANAAISVSHSRFIDARTDSIQADAGGTSTLDADIFDNDFSSGNIGINVSGANQASISFNIDANRTTSFENNIINVAHATGNGFLTGRIVNNILNGSDDGFGIRVVLEGENAEGPQGTILIDNNTITEFSNPFGIFAAARAGVAQLDVTITNNTVSSSQPFADDGIRVESGNGTAGEANRVCLNISGNTSSGGPGFDGIELQQRAGTTFQLQGLGAVDGTSDTAVEAFLSANNTGTTEVKTANRIVNYTNAAACATVP